MDSVKTRGYMIDRKAGHKNKAGLEKYKSDLTTKTNMSKMTRSLVIAKFELAFNAGGNSAKDCARQKRQRSK
jgi:hypothetical protein